MKLKAYISLIGVLGLLWVSSCGNDDDGQTLEQQQINGMQGTWVAEDNTSVMKDSNPAPGDWSNFSLTISNNNVSVSGEPTTEVNIWSTSTMTVSGLGSTTSFTAHFGPDQITINELTENTLNFTVILSGEDNKIGSRLLALTGTWTFDLTKAN